MLETTTSDAVLARLEALTRQMQAQAERLLRLDALEAKVADLEAENARLTATPVTPTVAPSLAPATTSRRGMLRRALGASAAAALLLVAKEAAQPKPVMAAAAMQFASAAGEHIDNVAHGITRISSEAPFNQADSVFIGQVFSGNAICGLQGQVGLRPTPSRTCGVFGNSQPHNTVGVFGQADFGSQARGVLGSSTAGIGVEGTSTSSAGVYGVGPIGVFATGTGVAGVFGGSNGNGFGFWGNSVASAGVYGTSTSGPGMRAESTNQWGLHAKSPTWAGVFEGNVFVTGRVIAQGGVGASATAATRTLAEDVGEATLANGKATVALGQEFADAANGDYRVFLTELADLGGLYVARKGPKEFEIRSRGGAGQAATSGRFDYRVVAKTAGANNPRQAPLAPPDLTTIKPAPPLPEPPKAHEARASHGRRER